jgi:hypothetical protein
VATRFVSVIQIFCSRNCICCAAMPAGPILRRQASELLQELRGKNPLVQCMQTPVSMDITANVLLSAGASPAMVCSEEESPAFVPKIDALYVNMGTLTGARVREVTVAIAEATRLHKPWVLDPVACGGTPFRTENCAKVMPAQSEPCFLRLPNHYLHYAHRPRIDITTHAHAPKHM